jgi:hypothetical protein
MASLQEFFGGLGLASGGPLFGTPAQDATQAMSKITTQYVSLSTQAEQLRQVLAAGGKVPCEVWAAYAQARQDYLTKAQPVFDQLAQKGITVEQVIYSAGKPRVDPNDASKVLTVQVQAPLRPPAFMGLPCPGLPNMAGAVGWQPVALGGSIANSTVAGLAGAVAGTLILVASGGTLMGVAAYGGYKTYKQVAVVLDEFDASPTRILAAYTSCVASGAKAGLAPTDAANRCSSVQQTAQQYSTEQAKLRNEANAGLGFWGWLGVIVGVAVVGTVAFKMIGSRAGAAVRLVSPVGGLEDVPGLEGVALGELYFRPHGGHRGRR